jgi:Mrp family chromosome partitioning ATPase
MTKIYEALENASKDRTVVTGRAATGLSGKPLPRSVEDKLQATYQAISAQIEPGRGAVVAFAGAQAGDDSAKLLIALARLASSKLQKRVLVLAAAPSPAFNQLGGSVSGWEEGVRTGNVDSLISAVNENLSVGQLASAPASLPAIVASGQIRSILSGLRNRFDLILIEAPSFGGNADAILMAPLVDGFVLVVEAGKTRHQAVRQYMMQIEAQQGRIFGVILNKRRLYIPGFIYRKL